MRAANQARCRSLTDRPLRSSPLPEHLRALVVILVLSTPVFLLAKAPITARICAPEDFIRRRNLWFGLTLAAHLAHNYWVFVLIAAFMLVHAARSESNRFAMYMALVLALPHMSGSIPGLVVNDLFAVTPVRLLSLCILWPTYLHLRKQPGVARFGTHLCDKLLLAYLLLEVLITLPYRTVPSILRDGVFYGFTDAFLPYYVASRALSNLKIFRDTLGAFIVAAMVLSMVLMFEFWRNWLLYATIDDALGVPNIEQPYLRRSGILRGLGTAGNAIIAGYTCAVAFGLYLYLRTLVSNRLMRWLGSLLLIGGLIGAFSRGPWVGAALMFGIFVMLGASPVANSLKLVGIGALSLPIILSTKFGQVLIDHLPWIGTVDDRSVDGREVLIDVAMQVFWESPVFGRFDVLFHPAMQALRGGDGLIDLTNTYVVIGLASGGVGLAIFLAFFGVACWTIFKSMRKVRDRRDERYVLGNALLSTVVGVLLILGTVSPILLAPVLFWILGGCAVAYGRLVEQDQAAAVATRRPEGGANAAGMRPTVAGYASGHGRPSARRR